MLSGPYGYGRSTTRQATAFFEIFGAAVAGFGVALQIATLSVAPRAYPQERAPAKRGRPSNHVAPRLVPVDRPMLCATNFSAPPIV